MVDHGHFSFVHAQCGLATIIVALMVVFGEYLYRKKGKNDQFEQIRHLTRFLIVESFPSILGYDVQKFEVLALLFF